MIALPRINVYSLKRPDPVTETRIFTDDRNPETPLELTFRATGDYNESLRISELAGKHVRDWVTGTFEAATEPGQPPKQKSPPQEVFIPGIGRLEPTETLCSNIAALQVLQSVPESEKPYDVMEWFVISIVMPTAFGEALLWALTILDSARRGPIKNAPGADTAASSVPPSTTT